MYIAPIGLEKLASVRLTTAAVQLDTGTFPARDFLVILWEVPSISATAGIAVRFNGIATNQYYRRLITNAAAASTWTTSDAASQSAIQVAGSIAAVRHGILTVSNRNQAEHQVRGHTMTSSGSMGTAAIISEVHGAWVGTAAQITSVQLRENAGTANLSVDTTLTVLGGTM